MKKITTHTILFKENERIIVPTGFSFKYFFLGGIIALLEKKYSRGGLLLAVDFSALRVVVPKILAGDYDFLYIPLFLILIFRFCVGLFINSYDLSLLKDQGYKTEPNNKTTS